MEDLTTDPDIIRQAVTTRAQRLDTLNALLVAL